MNLFPQLLQEPNSSIPLAELAARCNATEDFTLRIARALIAADVLTMPTALRYAHTPFSRLLLQPPLRASAMHMWDDMVAGMTAFGRYFEQRGYASPEDCKNTPVVYARGEKDVGFFDWLERDAKRWETFNLGMSLTCAFGSLEVAETFPWDTLAIKDGEEDKVVLVDVGGGNGQTLKEIRKARPDMKGKMVLQDLKRVVESGTVVDDVVDVMPYDFFEQVQPVKGKLIHALCA